MTETELTLLKLTAMGLDLSPVPQTLYHYTSADAFRSIVGSGHIWATDIRFLNDTSEVELLWQTALKRLEARRQAATVEAERASILELIAMATQRHSKYPDFVASFSENGDDLSQWRAYCHSGPGFSVGFASAALPSPWICNPFVGDSFFVGGSLRKVTYLSEEDTSNLDTILDFILEHLAPAMDGKQGFHGPVTKEQWTAGLLSVASSRYKHAAFRDEKEWRLILSKPHKPMPGQRFRTGKSSLVPYVEVELNRDHTSKQLTSRLIERVVIGPTPDPYRSEQSLRSLFASIGQPEVEIVPSTIPYKNW